LPASASASEAVTPAAPANMSNRILSFTRVSFGTGRPVVLDAGTPPVLCRPL
jgi:hypothetical protein